MKWGTTQICTFWFLLTALLRKAWWWEILRELIEGCLEIVTNVPVILSAMPKVIENWLQATRCPVSFHRNDFAMLKKKKKMPKALILKDHQSSFLMTAGHSQLEKDLKRLRMADLVIWRIFSFCYFNMNLLLLLKLMVSANLNATIVFCLKLLFQVWYFQFYIQNKRVTIRVKHRYLSGPSLRQVHYRKHERFFYQQRYLRPICIIKWKNGTMALCLAIRRN